MVRVFTSRGALLLALTLALSPALGGCERKSATVQEALGYERAGPDEMAVIKRPPLIVPPDYNLRPPRPGDQDLAQEAASEATRRTLLGPSASGEASPAEGGASPSGDEAQSDARAILTGAASSGAGKAPPADGASSEGQNLLISRTNRVEQDLDALTESRAENRVDSALLRRLLDFAPDNRPAPAEGEDSDDSEAAEDAAGLVQIVSRSQTLIGSEPAPDVKDNAE